MAASQAVREAWLPVHEQQRFATCDELHRSIGRTQTRDSLRTFDRGRNMPVKMLLRSVEACGNVATVGKERTEKKARITL